MATLQINETGHPDYLYSKTKNAPQSPIHEYYVTEQGLRFWPECEILRGSVCDRVLRPDLTVRTHDDKENIVELHLEIDMGTESRNQVIGRLKPYCNHKADVAWMTTTETRKQWLMKLAASVYEFTDGDWDSTFQLINGSDDPVSLREYMG